MGKLYVESSTFLVPVAELGINQDASYFLVELNDAIRMNDLLQFVKVN